VVGCCSLVVSGNASSTEGLSTRDSMRCLKRYIARELYPHITAIDLHQPTEIAA
jgi:hypothetical protein